MSLTGPEISDYRGSGQAALKLELPFVLAAVIGGTEPSLPNAVPQHFA